MKLAILAFATLLGLGSAARADDDAAVPRRPRVAQRVELQQTLLNRFDANHDGRLEPRERRHAIRALRRLTRRMAKQERRAERRVALERQVIRRYDLDGDGNVGPREMPPALRDRMRPLDRNGDGWIDDADQ